MRVSWNLNSLYKSDEHWKKELNSFKKDTKELKNYIGKATKSQTHLSFALGIKEKLDMRFDKLCAYPKLKQDINKNDYKYIDMNEELNKVASDYSGICSKLELEILKIPNKDYKKIISNKKINKKYGTYLKEVRRNKFYYLDDKSESILNKASFITSLPGNVYELFNNMDKKTDMTPAEYATKMESNDREVRKKAYHEEFNSYNENINTLSGLLTGQVKKNIFYADARGYDSSLEMYLKSDNIDEKVYNNLITVVNNNMEGLHKYTSLRKKALKVDKVHTYDMNVPMAKGLNEDIAYDKAQGIVYSTLAPLGKEYSDILYKAFNENWIDVYSGKNKVSGGYCLSVYEDHPYILLNYNNSINSVSTLTHELGHAVYEYMASQNQSYYNSGPSIFTHEVASTTNEALLYEKYIRNAKNNEEKAYYITQYLDLIKSTLYTQTMYAEFEKEIHVMMEKGKNVNTAVLNDLWGGLLQKYNGKDYELDQLSKVGWARIPHFYNSFYVYKYATGCSAGVTFAQDIQKNGPDNYVSFLKEGGSDYPINLLKKHGVNLSNTKPIENTINKFNSLVDELEKII
ncbi:oligoendopeptidase F [Metaclostridioides mangenotii]|uniref:oligoendopeptidase F n=1 Tax=Metaclostridioides mangenotii TaxID=1540 RepID=UPI003A5BA872